MDFKTFAVNAHYGTNHLYDSYLPYEFHLRMVVKVAEDYINLVEYPHRGRVIMACWGHDLIEDCRMTWNDIERASDSIVADIIYAVTNEKGKNRKERANHSYYEGIKHTNYATFVKLCDRIANVQYSKMTGSRMFEMYKAEQPMFKEVLFSLKSAPLWEHLDNLFD